MAQADDQRQLQLVPRTGVEPVRLAAPDFKSGTSTNFVTRASSGMLARTPRRRDGRSFWVGKRNQHERGRAIAVPACPGFVLVCDAIDSMRASRLRHDMALKVFD